MVWHILIGITFVIYLEILGKAFLSFLKIEYAFGMPYGFLLLLTACYITTSIPTALNCSFWLIFVIYSAIIVGSLAFVAAQWKKINWRVSPLYVLISILFVSIMLFYAKDTTLGSSNGFDYSFYINLISTNIKQSDLNSINAYYGNIGSPNILFQYSFQSFNYLASYLVYLFRNILFRITDASNLSIIIWVLQVVFDFFYVSLIINTLDRYAKDKRILWGFVLFVFLFFYGKYYYNNVYGFIGNVFRTMSIGFCTLVLNELIRERNRSNWILLGVCILGSCAFSSSSLFIVILMMFGMFFVLVDKEDKLFRNYSIILLLPLINLLTVMTERLPIGLIVSLVMCVVLYFGNDFFTRLSRIKYAKSAVLFVCFLSMFYLSYTVTGNIFDFSSFISNGSQQADMSIDYFDWRNWGNINRTVYSVMSLGLLLFASVFENKNDLIRVFLVLILVFFNPFCCSFLNKINIVYFRAYDIIINPATLILFMSMLYKRINEKAVNIIILVALVIYAINVDYLKPSYYHESFVPSENYNVLNKMSNDEYEVIKKIEEDLGYYELEKPFIVTPNILTESIITNGRYIFGRMRLFDENWSDAEKQIYAIFYPGEYEGDTCKRLEPDYQNVSVYLKEAGVDYLVVDKKLQYYDTERETYSFLHYKIAEDGYGYSILSNDSFELYCFIY